jgi:hypothetical protein
VPASLWFANATGISFTYKNSAAPAGPSAVKRVTLKGLRSLKVQAKASGLTLDEETQGTVRIALTIGDDVYCSECLVPARDEVGRYAARNCPAPAGCAGTPTTTTTTLPPGTCGNGIVDQAGEQCDGADLGTCDDIPIPFTIGCQPPSDADACSCCGEDRCAVSLSFQIRCCGDSECQDTTGFGTERIGACIPPACQQDADCHGYRCVNGTCCGNAGQLCGVAGCCPDTGTTCEFVENAFVNLCCKAPGVTCGAFNECCSLSCTAGACD